MLGVQLLLGGVPRNVVSPLIGSIHSNEHSDAICSCDQFSDLYSLVQGLRFIDIGLYVCCIL